MAFSPTVDELRGRIGTSAFSFRGYNVTNLGRTPELLEHRAYGAVMRTVLDEASRTCTATLGRHVDLVSRVRKRQETTSLATYAEDVALIVAVSQAHVRLLEEFFGITLRQAKLTFGYSLGEPSALIATGVYEMSDLLAVPVSLADDSVALADDVTLAVLFSRAAELNTSAVERLCLEITQEGKGIIAISAFLAPNSLILMGQNATVDRFQHAMRGVLADVYLRKNQHRWPPLHTPITWQRAIPNRAAMLLHILPGGLRAPSIPVISGVTGAVSYTDINSRRLLHQWIDHPQRFWDVVYRTLASGVETVVHVGPDPHLIPATFERLSVNVRAQLAGRSPTSLGLRFVSQVARRPWLKRMLPSSAALLRAPFIEQLALEDWLLNQKV